MNFVRYLSQEDAAALSRLAEHLFRLEEKEIALGEVLADIVATATILPSEARRHDVVGLNREVRYRRAEDNTNDALTIVLPHEAQPAASRISILAPLALALIGRCVGDPVCVDLPMGKTMALTICAVGRSAVEA